MRFAVLILNGDPTVALRFDVARPPPATASLDQQIGEKTTQQVLVHADSASAQPVVCTSSAWRGYRSPTRQRLFLLITYLRSSGDSEPRSSPRATAERASTAPWHPVTPE